jgi:hypothetical protein
MQTLKDQVELYEKENEDSNSQSEQDKVLQTLKKKLSSCKLILEEEESKQNDEEQQK